MGLSEVRLRLLSIGRLSVVLVLGGPCALGLLLTSCF